MHFYMHVSMFLLFCVRPSSAADKPASSSRTPDDSDPTVRAAAAAAEGSEAAAAGWPRPGAVCTTKTCVTAASSILNSMDESIDPCHDFYQYACGGWMRSNPIPPGESRWDTFGVLRRKNQIVIKNLLGKMTKN